MGKLYGILIGFFEILALLVIVSVSIFWVRRNILRIKRFFENKMIGWPKLDANLILYFEIILMFLFLFMNAADAPFQEMEIGNPIRAMIYNDLLIDISGTTAIQLTVGVSGERPIVLRKGLIRYISTTS